MNFKGWHLWHQSPNTMMWQRFDVNDTKIITLAEKYRAAHCTKLALAGPGNWKQTHCILACLDVRTMTNDNWSHCKTAKSKRNAKQPALQKGPSEGRCKTSWIWMSVDGENLFKKVMRLSGMSDGEIYHILCYSSMLTWDCSSLCGVSLCPWPVPVIHRRSQPSCWWETAHSDVSWTDHPYIGPLWEAVFEC